MSWHLFCQSKTDTRNPSYLPIILIGESFGFVLYYDLYKY